MSSILAGAMATQAEAAAEAPTTDAPGGTTPGAVTLPPQVGVMTSAFQTALDSAAARGMPLLLGAGVYRIAGVRIPPRGRIVGVPGSTRLALAGNGPILWAEGGASLLLRSLTIDGLQASLGTAQALVSLRGVGQVSIDDCTFMRSQGYGLHMTGCGGRVLRSRFSVMEQVGLFSIDSSGLMIEANTVEHCGNGGILVWRSAVGADGSIVRGNRIDKIRADAGGTGQNGNGINVYRAGNVMIYANQITNCAFTAIRCNSASNVQISNNQCFNSGETAIYAEFAFQGAVVTGNLVDGAALGISVVNFDQGGRLAVVRGNLVRNLKTTAPYKPDILPFGNGIAVEADATVSNNVVESAPNIGMVLGFGPFLRDINASANVIRDVGVGIGVSVVDKAGPAIIANNIIRTARRGAIIGYRHATAATADLIGGAGEHKHLTISGNRAEA